MTVLDIGSAATQLPAAQSEPVDAAGAASHWNRILGPYREPQLRRSLFQLISTALLFALSGVLMVLSLKVSYFLTLALALPAAGLLIRLFIIQHDCGHGSFFRSRRANTAVGSAIGVVMLTPYEYWRKTHSIHHATHGDLDRRDFGDVMTLTVKEYRSLSPRGRFGYRFYRNLFVMLVLGPLYQFGFKHRFPFDAPRAWRREWASVMWTNAAIAAGLVVAWLTIGLGPFFLVYTPVMLTASALGIWLFYVQHQFQDSYWTDSAHWSFHSAGIEGSSFYDLPKVLHWFTGNIGYHHIHHLASKIPNYRLPECYAENPELHQVTRLTMRESLRCARLKLWDEAGNRMVGFRELREMAASGAGDAAAAPLSSPFKLRQRSITRSASEAR